MQGSEVIISLIANVILSFALLYLMFGKKIISYIGKIITQRERRRKEYIKKIVLEYLEELRK
tara:strand:+ start:384 stop:569 length:186 start_codon:yes stop_codon:yes gene_type:complete